jgi:hypothetical protein
VALVILNNNAFVWREKMTREEFYEWLNTCPTHKWEITADEFSFVAVSFPTKEEEISNAHT